MQLEYESRCMEYKTGNDELWDNISIGGVLVKAWTSQVKSILFNILIYFLSYIIHGSSNIQATAHLHLHFLLFD